MEEFFDEEARFVIAPKGIASLAMLQCGLIQSISDPRLDGFWSIFERNMKERGYIAEAEEECSE